MLDAGDSSVQIGVTAVVCTIPAIATTGYRLWIRRGRYWADDAFALASAISQLLMFSGAFIHITNSAPRPTMIASYYIMAANFYMVVWFARLSILFSIIRIDPSPTRRRQLLVIAVIFFIITSVLVAQLWWVCEPAGPTWKNEESPQCSLTRQVVVLQVVTDVLSDLILIIAPLRLLQGLRDKPLRRRLIVIFSTCLITTAVSLVHAAFIFVHKGVQEIIAAIVEDNVSLIVCNIPVVVTSIIARRRAAQKNTTTRASDVRFATWPINRHSIFTNQPHTMDGSVAMGWTSTFRWDRDLGEMEEETHPNTSTDLSNTFDLDARIELADLQAEPGNKRVQISQGTYVDLDDTQKQTWHLQRHLI